MPEAFSKVQTTDRMVNQLQQNLAAPINRLNAVPLNSGLLVSDVDLVSGSNVIYTGLPQALTGWFLTRKNANVDIYDEQDTNTNPQTLILNSSGSVTVSVFVF